MIDFCVILCVYLCNQLHLLGSPESNLQLGSCRLKNEKAYILRNNRTTSQGHNQKSICSWFLHPYNIHNHLVCTSINESFQAERCFIKDNTSLRSSSIHIYNMNMYQVLYHRSNAATQIKHACKTFFWTNFQILLNKSVVSEVTIHPFKQQSAYSAHASIVPCKAVPTCLIFCILYTLLRYFLGNICDRQMQIMHNRGRKIRFF